MMDFAKYRDMFLTEAAEHLQQMAEQLVMVEKNPTDRDGIAALFREAHSIKGMAATMGYDATARLAHHLEDSLTICREQGCIDSNLVDRLLAGIDLLGALVEDIAAEKPERDVDSFIAGDGCDQLIELALDDLSELGDSQVVRPLLTDEVLIELRLDGKTSAIGPRLLVLIGQLGTLGTVLETEPSETEIMQGAAPRKLKVRLQTEQSQNQLRQQLQKYSELTDILFPDERLLPNQQKKRVSAVSTVRVSTDLLDHFINLTGELITNRYSLQTAAGERNWQDLNEGLGHLARLVKNLHHQVLQVRMMPLESVTGRLPRAVRDLCRSTGKEVELQIEGASIELDRAILEELTDPLMHMLRNAIDHGIEQQGTVQIKAWRERDQVLIQVADDGRGIDPEKVRQRALEKDLISLAQAETIRHYDLLQLICSPGFSTTDQISETSGRGVGMDVVKTSVERLGGVLLIDSTLGKGVKMTMKLPLSVAIIRVLLIECDDQLLAFPITRVLQTIELPADEVQTSGKQLVISHQDELLPLLSLRKILKKPKGLKKELLSLVVTEVLGRKIGLVVDRLAGQREVFVQTLPAPFDGLRGCGGGIILGDGRVIFLFDLQSLLEKYKQ